MKLKSNIGRLIKESGLRDDVFRERLNVQQHQLRKIKIGESFPTVPKLFALAEILKCSVDDLYDVIKEEEVK
ncbi:XRE family transcriptional regulator [Metabacillus indicus]|uniref:helix-turn-helix domain-containing protein n=1 Tax=Metabacillus indicus TaxID=246786 RepID=UPI002A0553E7|nr:XRE family transcriptional regulator [Metabacillus indicus]MDX8288819.1 XRE family transcriptional regulator [Metabacillus indicus]